MRRLRIASKCHDSGTSYGYAVNDPDGDYTYWTDHLAAIAAERERRGRMEVILQDILNDGFLSDTQINRARAAIDAAMRGGVKP